MESVARAAVIYLALLVLFSITGTRALAQVTTFDLALLLVISEAVQNALLGTDQSLTHALLLVRTLALLDIALTAVKQRWPGVQRVLDDEPLVIVRDGVVFHDRMAKEHIDIDDILSIGRQYHGIERLDQVKHAVRERSGHIAVVPYRERLDPAPPA
jgi:uncharacterized membrane protein YcaP (DUF421 family)